MKILIYLNHPAHFHLFKNTITPLKEKGNEIIIYSKKKDVLDDLLVDSGIEYTNVLTEGRKDTKFSMVYSVIKRGLKLFKEAKRIKPDLLIGTAFELAHIGKILRIPFISVNEDDANVIPLWSKYSYPWVSQILSPNSCNNGKWDKKTLKYNGYHELAYLHPNNFIPDRKILRKILGGTTDFVLIRFAKLNAHHDKGITGIDTSIAQKLLDIIKPFARVFITSERKLEPQFEKYRICINPIDIHHVLSFAKLYIGDSQTMAAEAAVLGIPFVRFNDFVGRIGYLDELENKYQLGFGIKPNNSEKLFKTVLELLKQTNLSDKYQERRKKMLNEMIDVNELLIWFMGNFPNSVSVMKNNKNNLTKFIK